MNFLQTMYLDGVLEHKTFSYQLSADTVQKLNGADVDNLVLRIQPEDIAPADAGERNKITVTVNVIEPLGDTNYVYFNLGETTYTTSVPSNLPLFEGDQLSITFLEERIHLFDEATGEAIKNRKFISEPETEWSVRA